ncbi:MAG: sulfur carrier protein ThiS [Ignavibacteria bacterium]|nr:sulfur carrier protein ThiS [Ignavibacteria bacterium]
MTGREFEMTGWAGLNSGKIKNFNMIIFVNDIEKTVDDTCTLKNLLESMNLYEQKGIAVAVNNSIVTKKNIDEYILKNNDRIIVIQAAQGG